MDRRTFLAAQSLALGAAAVGLADGAALAAPAASPNVLIAIPIIRTPNKSDEAFRDAARKFADVISKAPGFVDGVLLKATFKDTSFDYLEVTRWQTRQHWEALFSNKDYLALIESNDTFRIRAAEIFTPVEL